MMSAKIIAAMVAATALLAPITSASAQTQEFPRYWGRRLRRLLRLWRLLRNSISAG